MRIFIEPNDVLLFRDARPFLAGEDHRAVSLFPPTPLTMQGAIRSKVLANKDVSFTDYAQRKVDVQEIGYADDYGQLNLRGPFVARKENKRVMHYFPLPADVVTAGCSRPVALAPLPATESPFENNPPAIGPAPSDLLWRRSTGRIKSESGWLSETQLQRYLNGEPFITIPTDRLFERESRFHVGIDSQFKRPHQGDTGGHLFQIEFVRLHQGVGLWLEVNGVDLDDSGLLQLGGEAKVGMYEIVNDEPILLAGGTAKGKFKLYFATPAYFANGWRPNDWGFTSNGSVKLLAVATPRTQSIGGFDVARNQPKPMHRFVPAGSVFFFESDDEVTVDKPITDNDGQALLGQIGFGQVFIGRWDYV